MKPRCDGNRPGVYLSGFICCLDADHDGRCRPYQPPTVDEWRAMQANARRLDDIGADMLAVAAGCSDYSGGHRDACYDAFQDGIGTVVNALKARLSGDDSYQIRVLKSVGSQVVAAVQRGREG